MGTTTIIWKYVDNNGEIKGYNATVNQFKNIMEREQIAPEFVIEIQIDGEHYEATVENVKLIMEMGA